ncbi:unnamed protein product [Cercopithifilaria johnstoni]|uniref:Uncharacterized protein n=1 Tax=Cercopithifilaria johnstoni TaxID=2874296 RepID=A0A8J2Q984_9BILA|nr:unnamed protein product [Cercopithifilaria johnstoni]
MASTSSSPSSSGYGTLSKNNTVRNIQKQQNSVFGSSTMALKSAARESATVETVAKKEMNFVIRCRL